ncbi:MAG: DDE-type integrase/transposase/recombinase [Candidatus Omnitrophica bacterium]|nr:DDE-type integrase/transposase/recombinase [Candidatus Omnitrophota bacterium]
MYIRRQPEEIFRVATLAVAKKFFDNLIVPTIKDIAREAHVSEKQVHIWKRRLIEEGPKIFSSFKPGRKKEDISSLDENERLLILETINKLLRDEKRYEGKNQKFTAEFKEKILKERDRLREDNSITYEDFYRLMGISPRSVRDWAVEIRQEGPEGLKDHSRAPKNRPKKLSQELIDKIVGYGKAWKRHRGRINLTEFGVSFRWKYRNLLVRYCKTNLSDKTISRYLKEAGLYWEKEDRPGGKRGAYRYYFPGAQALIDTTVVTFLGLKVRLIGIMDAFSRDILHQEAFLSENAEKVIKSIKASLKQAGRIGIKVLSLVSDHGRSYKAKRIWGYLRGEKIYRIFSPPYWPQGKAALERYFRTLKEGITRRSKIVLLIKGIILWIKERIALTCLNLVLIGFNSEYEKKKGIDGKSPLDRLDQEVSPVYKEAVGKIFKEEERESQLKAELISSICKEFGFGMKIERVKRYLKVYRKEIIEKGAGVLRRKLVVEELKPNNRWYYLSKVIENMEKERKEAEIHRAKETIYQEKEKSKAQEERRKIEEEKLWYETHPEEALEEAIEWRLVMSDNTFARRHYDNMITANLTKILMRHSSFTAGLRVNKICMRIQEKERLENNRVIKGGSLPSGNKLRTDKEMLVNLIRQSYGQCKGSIPAFQGLRAVI